MIFFFVILFLTAEGILDPNATIVQVDSNGQKYRFLSARDLTDPYNMVLDFNNHIVPRHESEITKVS